VALLPRAGSPRGLSVRYPPTEAPLIDALRHRGDGVDLRPGRHCRRRHGLGWEWAWYGVGYELDMLFCHRGEDLHVEASHAPQWRKNGRWEGRSI
jgi:hypothetical protein